MHVHPVTINALIRITALTVNYTLSTANYIGGELMRHILSMAENFGVFEAAPVALAAAAVYLIIRVILLKAEAIKRKSLVSEIAGVLLAGYIAALLMIVWFSRWSSWDDFFYRITHIEDLLRDGYHYMNNKRVMRFFSDGLLDHERFEVLANVALFVPLGFLLPVFWRRLSWWQTDLICFGATCVIELVQPLFNSVYDLDDIITNTLGGIIGCSLAKISILVKKHVKNREKSG